MSSDDNFTGEKDGMGSTGRGASTAGEFSGRGGGRGRGRGGRGGGRGRGRGNYNAGGPMRGNVG